MLILTHNFDFYRSIVSRLNVGSNVFVANKYDDFDGYNDYEFLLKMFNKVNKADISDAQHRKTSAIIMKSILPYLRKRLKNTHEK